MAKSKKNKNLVPFNKMDREQHAKLSALGGIRSGKVRRMRHQLRIMLSECKSAKNFEQIKTWIDAELGKIDSEMDELKKTASA